jgi:hypothetical protein
VLARWSTLSSRVVAVVALLMEVGAAVVAVQAASAQERVSALLLELITRLLLALAGLAIQMAPIPYLVPSPQLAAAKVELLLALVRLAAPAAAVVPLLRAAQETPQAHPRHKETTAEVERGRRVFRAVAEAAREPLDKQRHLRVAVTAETARHLQSLAVL